MGTTKPRMEDLTPLMDRVERRLVSCSSFLSYSGHLQMVNSSISPIITYTMCSIKLPVGVIAKILIELENSASGEEMFKRKGVVTLLLGPWCRNPNPRVDWVSSTSDSRMMLSS